MPSEQLDRIEASLGVLTRDVSELKADVAVLKTDVSELKADVAVLKADVSGLKANVSGLTEDVSGLKAGQSRLEHDIAELRGGQLSSFARLERSFELQLNDMGTKLGVQIEEEAGQLKLLAEGHDGTIQIMNRRFDEQRDEFRRAIAPLDDAIREHTRELVAFSALDGPSGTRRGTPRRPRRRS